MTAATIHYSQWEHTTNENGFSSTTCVMKSDMAVNVVDKFHKALEKYAFHRYAFCKQYGEIRHVKESLVDGYLAMHIDFSENYLCKFGTEVQAAHFGHHNSIVLHQGIIYEYGKDPQAFCTISDDNRKTASAIAAHLTSILCDSLSGSSRKWLKLIIFSDSPSSQYRNKKTIFLTDYLRAQLGFEEFEWIYTEHGHGKSSADGVGAAVKRQADNFVAQGSCINNAQELMQLFTDSKIIMKTVSFEISTYL
jgi:hypothetical protein